MAYLLRASFVIAPLAVVLCLCYDSQLLSLTSTDEERDLRQ